HRILPGILTSAPRNSSMSRAFRLGITGKIGSGKSTLSRIAAEHGIKVLEADSIAKDLMESHPGLRQQLISIFGEDTYTEAGLNKSLLASQIYQSDDALHELESVVHPVTFEYIEEQFRKALPGEIVALESAILFQTGFDEFFDALILVDASDESVMKRIAASGKFSTDDISNRLKRQAYQKNWNQDADFVITNLGSEKDFIERCAAIVDLIKIVAQVDLPDASLRSLE
ncbi:MAG: dephospho-CoA kinase, partial [Ignavibacteriota bacterium]